MALCNPIWVTGKQAVLPGNYCLNERVEREEFNKHFEILGRERDAAKDRGRRLIQRECMD